MTDWDIEKAQATYGVGGWGEGYFGVDAAGRLVARPERRADGVAIPLQAVAHQARELGLSYPILMRFSAILHDRVDTLVGAFRTAMERDGYGGSYTAVYPIKVNQQRSVVEEILHQGNGRVGLEAGSKPELMAVLAMAPRGGTVICNGYKDREYIRLALIGRALGLRIFIVVEKQSELDLILDESARMGVEPLLGVRVRLSSIGAGKWQNTGGEKSKFGLSSAQLLEVVDRLQAAGQSHCLNLLHFHLGSQIANIRDIQNGMREAARVYVELHGLGVPVSVVDMGGGLGVDYEGSHSRSYCSMNYSVQEYADNVVRQLWEACDQAGLPCPDLISESGRALTAHHAVLVTNVTDVERLPEGEPGPAPRKDDPLVLHDLWDTLQRLGERPPLESWHDAVHWLSEAQAQYVHGVVDLSQRAAAEQLYTAICRRVRDRLNPAVRAHREALDELNEKLADKYFCNFSVFQSMPDVWGIDQVFPIVPLHRLDQHPERRGIIQDLTCDSDGRIDQYVDGEGIEHTLPLHHWDGSEYLLGFFMVGAYQEILGDMHNLFGDTDSVNVVLDGAGGYRLEQPERGDTVDGLLAYVKFTPDVLRAAFKEKIAAADIAGDRERQFLAALEEGLTGYTYLE